MLQFEIRPVISDFDDIILHLLLQPLSIAQRSKAHHDVFFFVGFEATALCHSSVEKSQALRIAHAGSLVYLVVAAFPDAESVPLAYGIHHYDGSISIPAGVESTCCMAMMM